MSHRGAKALRNNKAFLWQSNQRRDGRADALAGRPAMMDEEYYQQGYAEGLAPCQCSNSTAHSDGCQRQPAKKEKLCSFCIAGHNQTGHADA